MEFGALSDVPLLKSRKKYSSYLSVKGADQEIFR